MNMIQAIPRIVRVVALEQETGKAVEEAVIIMRAIVPRKNNYEFGPKITNAGGEVCFTIEEMMREVELSRTHVLMDYSSDITETLAFKVEVPDEVAIQGCIDGAAMWGIGVPEWRLSDEMVDRLRKATNRDYMPKKVVVNRRDFTDPMVVKVLLQRKRTL